MGMLERILHPRAGQGHRTIVTQMALPASGSPQEAIDSNGLGPWTDVDVWMSTLGVPISQSLNVRLFAVCGSVRVAPGPAALNNFSSGAQPNGFQGLTVKARGVGCNYFVVTIAPGGLLDVGKIVQISLTAFGREPVGNAA